MYIYIISPSPPSRLNPPPRPLCRRLLHAGPAAGTPPIGEA